MQGLPPAAVTCNSRELLPHVFTIAFSEKKAVIFCGTFCYRVSGTRLFTGALPCAVRTFLPFARAVTRFVDVIKLLNFCGMQVGYGGTILFLYQSVTHKRNFSPLAAAADVHRSHVLLPNIMKEGSLDEDLSSPIAV